MAKPKKIVNKFEPQVIRREDGRIEITCRHGIGHTVYSPNEDFVHGCDGCCRHTQNNILLNNVAGVFETDSKGQALKVKEFGNDAIIPFSKKWLDKRVVVLVMDK